MAIAKNDASVTARPSTPNGQCPSHGSAGIEAEAASVTSVSWTIVPVGGEAGVTGFDPKVQVAFAGSPEQLSVNLRFEPGAAYSASGITRLWPAVTAKFVGG